MNTFKKTALAAAVTTAMGMSAPASADIITVAFDGLFSMLDASGVPIVNTDQTTVSPWYGNRTAITGTMSFDTSNGSGTGQLNSFSFFGKGLASGTTITFQAIGNGFGGTGPLVLANMGFNWNANNGIPVSLVMDASGFFGAVAGGITTSDIITGGATPATNGTLFGGKTQYTLPMGPGPVVSTTWNTTTIGGAGCGLGCNPSGTLPLLADALSLGGTPMPAGPFKGSNANFDIITLHVVSVDTGVVPVPAAVWLFGSGLVGLVGVARRRKSA